jgi:protein ImuB
LTAVNDAAAALGLREGQSFADACAIHPELEWAKAAPEEDARLLHKLVEWAERYTPFAGSHPPDALILDITGCAHLFGGEAALVQDALKRLKKLGFLARAGIADAVGAAWAVAHYGKAPIVASGKIEETISSFPLASLRLHPDLLAGLRQIGLRSVADIMARPRAPLTARFGSELLFRLDQALGRVEEPVTPRIPIAPYSVEQAFPEPLTRDEDLLAVLAHLIARLCRLLQQRDEGARELVASFFTVDGKVARLEIGTSRPLRDASRLYRLFTDKFALSSMPSEFGFDRIRLCATADPFQSSQRDLSAGEDAIEFSHLVDRLSARLGEHRVLKLLAQDTHVPEEASVIVPAASAAEFYIPPPERGRSSRASGSDGGHWSKGIENIKQDTLALARPLRLFERPEPIEVLAEIPDGPPARFRWRRVLHQLARAEGPERIALPWWLSTDQSKTRDYFRVEALDGARFWLYREGLYGTGTVPRWFLHGLLP